MSETEPVHVAWIIAGMQSFRRACVTHRLDKSCTGGGWRLADNGKAHPSLHLSRTGRERELMCYRGPETSCA